MTSGTRTIDRTWVGPSYCSQSTTFGERIVKTWSGADTPKARPSYTNVYNPENGRSRRVWVKPPHRDRERPENNYSMSLVRVNDPPMFMKIGSPPVWQMGSVKQCYGGGSNWPADPMTVNDKNQLISSLRDAVLDSDFNVGVFLAESNQALKMIGDNTRQIARAVTALRRGRPDIAWRQLVLRNSKAPRSQVKNLTTKDFASWFLELQYGWKPLINDIYDGAQMINHYLGSPMRMTIKVSITRKGPLPTSLYSGYSWLHGKNTSRRQIIAKISEVNVAKLTGLTDPAQILWEKLPWSFIADWIIPVGTYLSARGVSNSVTGKFITSHKWERSAGSPTAIGSWIINAPNYHETLVNFDRVCSNNLVVAWPTVKGLQKVATWQHAANGVALLRQAFK